MYRRDNHPHICYTCTGKIDSFTVISWLYALYTAATFHTTILYINDHNIILVSSARYNTPTIASGAGFLNTVMFCTALLVIIALNQVDGFQVRQAFIVTGSQGTQAITTWVFCTCVNATTADALFIQVTWNVPTQKCKTEYDIDVDVTKYGMVENPVDGWVGPHVVVVRTRQLWRWRNNRVWWRHILCVQPMR